MQEINKDTIVNLLKLTKLKASDEEIELYIKQINSVVEHIKQLQTIDTKGVKPTYQIGSLSGRMRPDQIKPQVSPQALLDLAPESNDGYIVTKGVMN